MTLSGNRNPHLAWDGVPEGTRSLVLMCIDTDAPSVGDDVNQDDRSVPHDLPRADFHHWVMVDIPPTCTGLEEGACSDGAVARGKTQPGGPDGARQGVNDYTGWFAGDPEMEGTYRGYDGPAPPWNDERVHSYRFSVSALDAVLELPERFDGQDLIAAMGPHMLDRAELVGLYAINPNARQT